MMVLGSRPLAGAALATMLGVAVPAAAQGPSSGTGVSSSSSTSAGGLPANANVSGGREHQPGQAEVRTRESRAGIAPRAASQQDRDLDAIGKQLLAQTPKSPAGSTLQTGGGTAP